MRSFVKIKSSRNGKITLSITDIVKSCPIVARMSFNAIRENKSISKISGFTVFSSLTHFARQCSNCLLSQTVIVALVCH